MNRTEPSVCSGDAALCPITLAVCSFSSSAGFFLSVFSAMIKISHISL